MKSFPKILLILSLGVVVSGGLVWFLINPALSSVDAINETAKAKQIELAVLEQQIRAFKTAQSDLAKATRKDEIANVIVAKEELVIPVKDIEAAAEKTLSAETKLIKEPDAKAKPLLPRREGIGEVGYILTLNNDFVGMANFIAYLENLPHYTEISKIILSAETTGVGEVLVHTGRVFGNIEGILFMESKPETKNDETSTNSN
jgi:hypothetical protein